MKNRDLILKILKVILQVAKAPLLINQDTSTLSEGLSSFLCLHFMHYVRNSVNISKFI